MIHVNHPHTGAPLFRVKRTPNTKGLVWGITSDQAFAVETLLSDGRLPRLVHWDGYEHIYGTRQGQRCCVTWHTHLVINHERVTLSKGGTILRRRILDVDERPEAESEPQRMPGRCTARAIAKAEGR